MPRDTDRERLTAFAKDYAHLYARFSNHFSIPERATIDGFSELFDASHIEFLHYCGGTTLERPFFPSITSELLMLSSAYLSIPEAVSPRGVRTFGLLLSFFLYSTQPARQRPKVPASVEEEGASLPPVPTAASFAESAPPRSGGPRATRIAMMADSLPSSGTQQPQSCSASEETAATAPSSPPVPSSLLLPMQPVPVSVSCMRLLLSRLSIDAGSGVMSRQTSARAQPPRTDLEVATASSSPAQLSHTETKVVLALHRASGWHIEPYLRQGKHISALLSAHQAFGVPLVSHVTSVPRALFATTLTARSMLNAAVAPEEMGGSDSLFRDPDFVQLRQSYEEARRRLLLGERR